jgi:hypothetical protein
MRTDTSRFIQAALSAAAVSVAAGLASEWRTRQVSAARRERDDSPKPIDQASRRLIRSTIQYFLVPLWSAVASPTGGVTDAAASRIQRE